MTMPNIPALIEEIARAIATATAWTEQPAPADAPPGFRSYNAQSNGWFIVVVSYADSGVDGAATSRGTVVRLTPALAKAALEQATTHTRSNP